MPGGVRPACRPWIRPTGCPPRLQVVRRKDLDTDVEQVLTVLEKHPSVTHLDISQDTWSPTTAAKILRIVRENNHLKYVDAPTRASVRPSQLQTIEALVALNNTCYSTPASVAPTEPLPTVSCVS